MYPSTTALLILVARSGPTFSCSHHARITWFGPKEYARQAYNHQPQACPKEFTPEITGSRVWSGQDVTGLGDLIVQLSSADIMEIESALAAFECKSLDTPYSLHTARANLIFQLFRGKTG